MIIGVKGFLNFKAFNVHSEMDDSLDTVYKNEGIEANLSNEAMVYDLLYQIVYNNIDDISEMRLRGRSKCNPRKCRCVDANDWPSPIKKIEWMLLFLYLS
uniref:Uncharacterized protein n=1 Tax=Strongyloides papillosus TaxID=174720 RepID=A0A0N5CBS6_STREA